MNVTGHSFSELGKLVEIGDTQSLELKNELPTVVVVVDTSGSMGDLVGSVLCGCIPDAMEQSGYDIKETQVYVITFASYADVLKINENVPTAYGLRNQHYRGDGTIRMSSVFQLLVPQLKQRSNVCLLGISDGEIEDIRETLEVAKSYNDTCANHVEVLMVRLKTSPTSNPDPSALACLAQFATNSSHSIHDVITYGEEWMSKVTTLFKTHMTPRKMVRVRGNDIRRTPCDSPNQMV